MEYNKKFTDQVKDAKVAYLDKGGIMHVLHEELATVKKKGFKCLDISDKNLKCASGYPLVDKDNTAILKMDNGKIVSDVPMGHLAPVLKGIYEELQALK